MSFARWTLIVNCVLIPPFGISLWFGMVIRKLWRKWRFYFATTFGLDVTRWPSMRELGQLHHDKKTNCLRLTLPKDAMRAFMSKWIIQLFSLHSKILHYKYTTFLPWYMRPLFPLVILTYYYYQNKDLRFGSTLLNFWELWQAW